MGAGVSSYVSYVGYLFSSEAQEVVPGLWIGQVASARDGVRLRTLGISHVVNVCEAEYQPTPGVEYLVLPVPDVPSHDILPTVRTTNEFIHRALQRPGNAVLVHCMWGRSRSAAVVLAYLMSHRGMSYDESLAMLVSKRPVVSPNHGFEAQLRTLRPPPMLLPVAPISADQPPPRTDTPSPTPQPTGRQTEPSFTAAPTQPEQILALLS